MNRIILFLLACSILLSSFGQNRLYEHAEKAYINEDLKLALELIQQKISRNPQPEDHLLEAMVYERLGQRPNAEESFLRAIEARPDYLEALFHFASFQLKVKDYDQVIATISFILEKLHSTETLSLFFRIDPLNEENVKVQSLSTMESQALMLRGKAFEAQGMFEIALKDYEAAVDLDRSADKLVNRGLLHLKLQNRQAAIEDFHQAIDLRPRSTLAWFNLLLVDSNVNLPPELRQDKDFLPMLSLRAVEAVEKGEYYLAEKLYEQGLTLDPENVLLLVNAGRLNLRNGFNKLALKRFQKAQQLDNKKTEIRYLIGNAHFGLKQFEEALIYYQDYLKTDPFDGSIWFNAAMCYLELKESDKACEYLQRAHENGFQRAEGFIFKYCTNE